MQPGPPNSSRLAHASPGRTPLAEVYAAWSQVRPDQVGSITSLDVQSFAHDLHARRCTGTRSTRFWPGDVRMVLFGFTALLRVRK